MSDEISPQNPGRPQVVVVGPDGMAIGSSQDEPGGSPAERPVTEMVEQPAKVMRIGSMIRQLLEEVKSAPLDEKSRARLKEIHQNSIKGLEGLFHGIQTTLFAQQMAARAQLEQMRRALPPGLMPAQDQDQQPLRGAGPYL